MSRNNHFILFQHLPLIYGRVPKVANSSIKASLCRLLRQPAVQGLRSTSDSFWTKHTNGETTMIAASDVLKRQSSHFCFSFVRNPFDRIVSAYNNKIIEVAHLSRPMERMGLKHGMAFPDFIQCVCDTHDQDLDVHLLPQASMLCLRDRLVPHFVGHFESLATHWSMLQQRLASEGLPGLGNLPSKNVRRQPGADLHQHFATDHLIELVHQRYRRDFEVFYTANSLQSLLAGQASTPEPLQQLHASGLRARLRQLPIVGRLQSLFSQS
ncbi:MAG: sulfotransferase family protein [Cyanobacteriota bacterium]|jgi:dermatan 4-sulfotransferase 1